MKRAITDIYFHNIFQQRLYLRCCEFLQQTRATLPPEASLLSATFNFAFCEVLTINGCKFTSSKPRSSGEWRKRAGGCDSWCNSFDHFDFLWLAAVRNVGLLEGEWSMWMLTGLIQFNRRIWGGKSITRMRTEDAEQTRNQKTDEEYQPRQHIVQGRVQGGRGEGGRERWRCDQLDVGGRNSSLGRSSTHVCNYRAICCCLRKGLEWY